MDTDAATATVTTDEAAARLGVSARTIRRWIQRGILPATQTPDGYLLIVGDLADLRVLADARPRPRSRPRGHGHTVTDTATMPDTDTATPRDVTVNPNARAQLEAIRDEWLQPLVETITRQAEQIGRLEAERDGATSQLLAQDETIAALRRRAEAAEVARVELLARVEYAEQEARAAELTESFTLQQLQEENDALRVLAAHAELAEPAPPPRAASKRESRQAGMSPIAWRAHYPPDAAAPEAAHAHGAPAEAQEAAPGVWGRLRRWWSR